MSFKKFIREKFAEKFNDFFKNMQMILIIAILKLFLNIKKPILFLNNYFKYIKK